MKIDLPPALFYGVGIILIVFGVLRAHQLGWLRRHRETPADADAGADVDATPRMDPTARRHMVFGLLWVVMGIFLVVSTYLNARR
jgi:uncharacterized membrane protein HdeD (DUF308 family)